MAKGFKHGGGGGGGSLNFNVVLGTSQPSSPKENDIWVNTSNTSNATWVFSATQPTGQTNLVWIKTGTDSGASFNALKENGIWVYPMEAKQYVNRSWKDVTAKSYIGGKWVEWISDLWLFDYGEVSTDITGGFVYKKIDGNGTTVQKNADGSVSLIPPGGENYGTGMYYTAQKFDLTNYNTLHFYGVIWDYELWARCGVGVYSDIGNADSTYRAAYIANFQDKQNTEHTLDISKLTGSFYIGTWCGPHSNYVEFTMCRVWLTK